MRHLAIFDRRTVEKILSGEKTCELRVSKRRIPPFGLVRSGDTVLVKISGGKLVGQFQVGEVIFIQSPKRKRIIWLKQIFRKNLCLPPDFWREREDARYFTLMEIVSFSRFLTPPTILKKKDRRGWVILG